MVSISLLHEKFPKIDIKILKIQIAKMAKTKVFIVNTND